VLGKWVTKGLWAEVMQASRKWRMPYPDELFKRHQLSNFGKWDHFKGISEF